MTTTYILKSANSDLSGGADFNKVLSTGAETVDGINVSVAALSTEVSYGFTPLDTPGAFGATGDYTVEIDVTIANSQLRLSTQLHRINSAGTVQASSSTTAEQTPTTGGVYTFAHSAVGLGTWTTGDRLRVDYRFRNVDVLFAQSLQIATGVFYAEVVTPFTAATPTASRTMPDVTTEIGFTAPTTSDTLHLDDPARGKLNTGKLAATDIFTDVSQYVRTRSIKRGSSRADPIIRYETGASTTVLKNADRRFDPTNLSGPYVVAGVTQVKPMRTIRHRATWAGQTYDLWRGFVDSWALTYSKRGNYTEAVITASDGFKVLANHDRGAVAAVGAGEDSGARVNRILDSTDWETTDRVIATGNTTLQSTTLAAAALTELFLVADTEIGELYIDGAGRVVFRNRHALLTEARSNTSQAMFGDGSGEFRYSDIIVEYDEEQLVNEATVARNGGTEQIASDAASKSAYLTHSFNRTDLLMQTDAVALNYAQAVVYQNKDPELRVAQLVIDPLRDPSNLFPQVLGREIGDRITVKLRPDQGDAISRDVFIRGIAHEIGTDSWRTTWTLQSATQQSFFVLNNAVLGTLDANALSY